MNKQDLWELIETYVDCMVLFQNCNSYEMERVSASTEYARERLREAIDNIPAFWTPEQIEHAEESAKKFEHWLKPVSKKFA